MSRISKIIDSKAFFPSPRLADKNLLKSNHFWGKWRRWTLIIVEFAWLSDFDSNEEKTFFRTSKIEGSITVNGQERNLSVFRKLSAYIMQDNQLHSNLTVEEAMNVAANLKLSQKVQRGEKMSVVSTLSKSICEFPRVLGILSRSTRTSNNRECGIILIASKLYWRENVNVMNVNDRA